MFNFEHIVALSNKGNDMNRNAQINKLYSVRQLERSIASWTEVLNNTAAIEAHDLARRTIENNKRQIKEILDAPETTWN